jgi:hypothetical protein
MKLKKLMLAMLENEMYLALGSAKKTGSFYKVNYRYPEVTQCFLNTKL